jgi:cell division protein FtsB
VEREGAFEPGERVKVRLYLNFTEVGAYGAFFYVVIPVWRGGAIGWVAAAKGELKVDVYEPGVQRAEVELTVPEDVSCGFPPYVYAGLVWATEEGVRGSETYALPLGVPACRNTTVQAVTFWRGIGGREGLLNLTARLQRLLNLTAQLKEENQQLRSQLAELADRARRLEAEKSALQAEVERQVAENARLRARLEALQAESGRQAAENAALRQRAAALEAENAQLKIGAILLAAAAVAAIAVALLRRRK